MRVLSARSGLTRPLAMTRLISECHAMASLSPNHTLGVSAKSSVRRSLCIVYDANKAVSTSNHLLSCTKIHQELCIGSITRTIR